MVNVSKQTHSAKPSATVHKAAGDALLSLAADNSSAVISTFRAISNVAGARGESPRDDDPSSGVDLKCESDEMADFEPGLSSISRRVS